MQQSVCRLTQHHVGWTVLPNATWPAVFTGKLVRTSAIQLQYNCNTRIFFLYCSCIALVRPVNVGVFSDIHVTNRPSCWRCWVLVKVPCTTRSHRRGWLWHASQCSVIEPSFVPDRRTRPSLNGIFIMCIWSALTLPGFWEGGLFRGLGGAAKS